MRVLLKYRQYQYLKSTSKVEHCDVLAGFKSVGALIMLVATCADTVVNFGKRHGVVAW
jgi:hypothetical protein